VNPLPAHLAAVLGHELRNPLASAVTGASLVRELLDGSDPRRATVDLVLRDLGRLDRLLNSWLDLARTGQLRRERVDLLTVLARAANGRANVNVQTDGADTRVSGDGALLQRAFENLIENALAAGAANVQLRVDADDERGMVSVRIDDDGPGVPADRVAEIFAPGVSSRGSTGLGLTIVQSTIAVHGGRVRCEPRSGGGRFVVELALARPALAAVSA
jgi:signal transduction histidine kinase